MVVYAHPVSRDLTAGEVKRIALTHACGVALIASNVIVTDGHRVCGYWGLNCANM